MSPRELLSTADVAVELGVTPRRVLALLGNRRRTGFPAPYATTRERAFKLWRPADIERWAATWDRSPGRRRKS